jgi:hypothetical protein
LVNDNKGPEAAQYVTETILLKYGNELIEVNHMNLTYTVDAQPHSEKNYWEKSTGLIIEWIISSSEVEDNLIETTNIIFQRVGLQQVFYP